MCLCLSLPLYIVCWKDTTMDNMTPDIEDIMIRLIGLITMTAIEAETATIINRCILPGMKKCVKYKIKSIFL